MKKAKILFEEWALKWLQTINGTVKSNTYEATYRNTVVNHLIPAFKGRTLDEIKPYELQNFLNKSCEEYCCDTVKKFKSCLTQMYNEALYNEFCSKNPCYRLKVVKRTEVNEKQVYTQSELDMIKAYAVTHRYGIEIMLLAETGIRRGELLALTWADIELHSKVINITKAAAIEKVDGIYTTRISAPKNISSVRKIPASTELCDYLADYKKTCNPDQNDSVIVNSSGKGCNPRNWQRRHYDVFMVEMQEYYKDRGINIPYRTPHSFRHTRASLWVNSGKNLYAVAKALGHSDLDMLQKRYAHSNVEQIRFLLNIE